MINAVIRQVGNLIDETANEGQPGNLCVDELGRLIVVPTGAAGSGVDQGASNGGSDPWAVTDAGLSVLTDGTQIAQTYSAPKGGSGSAPVTSTAQGSDHQGLDVVEQFAPRYEDNTAQRALVEQRNSYANITTATTTTVKSGAGFLHRIQINKSVASATITIYDSLTATGTKIGTLTFGASLLTDFPTAELDVAFSIGLTIVTSGATDITVSYR